MLCLVLPLSYFCRYCDLLHRNLSFLEAENFWKFVELHAELDLDKGKEGSALDEFNVRRVLFLISTLDQLRKCEEE